MLSQQRYINKGTTYTYINHTMHSRVVLWMAECTAPNHSPEDYLQTRKGSAHIKRQETTCVVCFHILKSSTGFWRGNKHALVHFRNNFSVVLSAVRLFLFCFVFLNFMPYFTFSQTSTVSFFFFFYGK